MSDEQQEFTPEQIAEFQAYENYLADKAHKESSTAMYPVAGGVAGAGVGAASSALEGLTQIPDKIKASINGMGKSFASGAKEGMAAGDKWAQAIGGPGGATQDAAVANRAMQKSLTPAESAKYAVAREGLILPKGDVAKLTAEEALKNSTLKAKLAQMTGKLAPFAPAAGRALALGSAGYEAGDVMDRINKGQYGRAIVSGAGALGSLASMVPHPLTRGVGIGASMAAPAANMYLDKLARENPELAERLHFALGGLVNLR